MVKKPNDRLGFDESVAIDAKTNRTVRRVERLRRVLEQHQFDLHLLLEDVHDPHNVSAVLRTCDAVGVEGRSVVSLRVKRSRVKAES